MRKGFAIILLSLATSVGAQNYSKMSSQLRLLVHNNATTAKAKCSTGNNGNVIIFAKGDEKAMNGYCISHQGDIHIINVPINNIATLSEDAHIQRLEANFNTYNVLLDSAASIIHADKAWQGTALPQAFDGTGVVVGNVDVAQDYTHPTFRSTKDGRLRIVRAWDIFDIPEGQEFADKSPFPFGTFLTDTTEIKLKGCSKDSYSELHGTHTAGIASGSGWGTAFRGIAPESDIYMASTPVDTNLDLLPKEIRENLSDALYTLQFQNIFSYADSVHKPCVINFSIGGDQDMTNEDSLFNAYLNSIIGPGHIFVASAGNSGKTSCSYLPKGKNDTTVGGKISTKENSIELNVSTQHKLTLRIRDISKPNDPNYVQDIALDLLPHNTESKSGLKWNQSTTFTKENVLDSLGITVYAGLDGFNSDNVGYDIFIRNGKKEIKDYPYSIELIGENAEAEAFIQGGQLLAEESLNLKGALPGGNIVSPGSLPNTICVGATAYRTSYINTSGQTMTSNQGTDGELANYSSIGPTLHGLIKPDISAPGTNISSSRNSFLNEASYKERNTATVDFGNKKYHYISISGTSMATPVVTGTIALWLQADPTLTKERIIEIFSKTSKHNDPTLSYPNNQYGYGEIDAYKGLLEVLNISNVEGLSTTMLSKATVRPAANRTINITFDAEQTAPVTCRLYSTSGALLKTETLLPHSTTHTVSTDGHTGVIAVQVGDMGSTLVRVEK